MWTYMKYQIKGEPMPVVICQLDGGESMICESGSMCWMTPNMQMETTGGGIGGMLAAAGNDMTLNAETMNT